jgi:uncharacterized protein with von Willebrand factor type A (vWA) domain
LSGRSAGHRYRAWDGLQTRATLAPDELLERLGDRFLSENAGQVLNDVLHRGLETPDGAQLAGLDELREAVRRQLRHLDPEALQRAVDELRASGAAGSEGLSDDANRLLDAMALNPPEAGRLLSGASPGVRRELECLADAAGPLQPGGEPVSLLELAALEGELRRVRSVADVEGVDPERIVAALGEDLAGRFVALARSLADFEGHGYLDPSGAGLKPRAIRQLGQSLLRSVLADIESRLAGDHDARRSGAGLERADSTRAYQFGDPFDLDLAGTVLQAVRRAPGTPVRLASRDMTIFEREETGRVATLLAIDRSRSMGQRGYLLAAKRLALALTTLIHTRFPRDRLDLLVFSNEAQSVAAPDLVGLEWDRFAIGTNVHDALAAGRRKLAQHSGLQRILVLITDGEPTAYRDAGGEVRYSEPPTLEALAATYAEARRCRREQIQVIVALLSRERQIVSFARELARHAEGRLVLAEPDDLSIALLLGYGRLRRV